MLRSALPCTLLVAMALGSGCNSFDPNLGASPFRCSDSEPRCPEGYKCVEHSPSNLVCEKESFDPDAVPDASLEPDAVTVVCEDDSEIEPNDTLNDPTITSIPTLQDTYKLVGLAICPADDNDYFVFEIDANGKTAEVIVEYRSDRGELLVDLLDGNGISIASATPVDDNPDNLRLARDLDQGTYYVQVRSSDGAPNNYSIEINTSGGS